MKKSLDLDEEAVDEASVCGLLNPYYNYQYDILTLDVFFALLQFLTAVREFSAISNGALTRWVL